MLTKQDIITQWKVKFENIGFNQSKFNEALDLLPDNQDINWNILFEDFEKMRSIESNRKPYWLLALLSQNAAWIHNQLNVLENTRKNQNENLVEIAVNAGADDALVAILHRFPADRNRLALSYHNYTKIQKRLESLQLRDEVFAGTKGWEEKLIQLMNYRETLLLPEAKEGYEKGIAYHIARLERLFKQNDWKDAVFASLKILADAREGYAQVTYAKLALTEAARLTQQCLDQSLRSEHEIPEKALALLENSKKYQSLEACFQLGVAYQDGIIVNRDLEKAYEYYREAADRGHTSAVSVLELRAKEDEIALFYLGLHLQNSKMLLDIKSKHFTLFEKLVHSIVEEGKNSIAERMHLLWLLHTDNDVIDAKLHVKVKEQIQRELKPEAQELSAKIQVATQFAKCIDPELFCEYALTFADEMVLQQNSRLVLLMCAAMIAEQKEQKSLIKEHLAMMPITKAKMPSSIVPGSMKTAFFKVEKPVVAASHSNATGLTLK